MKRVTRLLFLTFFVIPILTISNVSAFEGPAGRAPVSQRDFQGHRDPFNNHIGDISPSSVGNDPLYHIDPFAGNDFHNRILERDPFVQGNGGGWSDPNGGSSNGGGTAPLDGGLSLLLAAGIGLGMKKARASRKANQQKSIDITGDIS
jgi:hypothetical protein